MRGPRLTIASMLGIVALARPGHGGTLLGRQFLDLCGGDVDAGNTALRGSGGDPPRGGERAFCLGFSLFAAVYLVLVDWDWIGGQFGHDLTIGSQRACRMGSH